MAKSEKEGPFVFSEPIGTHYFPPFSKVSTIILADFFSRTIPGAKAAFPIQTKPRELKASFARLAKYDFFTRNDFLAEGEDPKKATLISSEEAASSYFSGIFLQALDALSIGNEGVAFFESDSDLAKYIRNEIQRKGASSEREEIIPFCPSCGTELAGMKTAKILKKQFALFQIGEFFLAAEFENPEELFSATAVSVEPDSMLSLVEKDGKKILFQREILSLSGDLFPARKILETPGRELVGAAAKNPATGEFIPALPKEGAGPSILSPGTKKADLDFLRKFSEPGGDAQEKWKLSGEKIDSIQVKVPIKGGIFTESCGGFFGFPAKRGREAIIAKISKEGFLAEIFLAVGVCPCGERSIVPKKAKGVFFNSKGAFFGEVSNLFPGKIRPFSRAMPADSAVAYISPLFKGISKAKTEYAYDYLFGLSNNFNLAWKDSGFEKKDDLLAAKKELMSRAKGAVFIWESEGSLQEAEISFFSSFPPGAFELGSRRVSKAGGKKKGETKGLLNLLKLGFSDELRLQALSRNPKIPTALEAKRLSKALFRFRKAALSISSLPDFPEPKASEFLRASYLERKGNFFSCAEKFDSCGALSALFSFLSDFSDYRKMGGSKQDALSEFRDFARLISLAFPRTGGEIERILGTVRAETPENAKPQGEIFSGKKALQARNYVRNVLADLRTVFRLAKESEWEMREARIYVSEEWKFRLAKRLSFSNGALSERDLALIVPLGTLGREVEEFVGRWVKTLKKNKGGRVEFREPVLTAEEEARALSGAVRELKLAIPIAKTVQIILNGEIPTEKRSRALPERPAILLS